MKSPRVIVAGGGCAEGAAYSSAALLGCSWLQAGLLGCCCSVLQTGLLGLGLLCLLALLARLGSCLALLQLSAGDQLVTSALGCALLLAESATEYQFCLR